MGKRVLAIEIGVKTTKVCEIDYTPVRNKGFSTKTSGRNSKVYQTLIFDTPENAVEDGFVRDKQGLEEAFRQAMTVRQIDFTTLDVIFTLNSSKIASREVEIPMVKPDKIPGIIEANASDYFPVDISDYVISYNIVDQIVTPEEKKYRLTLLAAPKNLINNIYSFADQMKFHVISLDYIGNSVYQVMRRQITDSISLSVQINEQTSLINIIEGDKLMMQRVLNVGSLKIVDAVMEYADELRIEDEEEAVEYLKKNTMINYGFDQPMPLQSDNMTDEQYYKISLDYQIRDAITESLRYLVNNIARVIDYYRSKNPDKRIVGFYMTGDASWYKGISHLFRKELEFSEIKKIETVSGIKFQDARTMEAYQSEFISCIGATFAPVGFVTKDRMGTEEKGSIRGTLIVLAASAAVSVVMFASATIMKMMAESERDDLNAQIAAIQNVDDVFAEHDNVLALSGELDTLYAFTTSQNEKLNATIKELEKILPSQMTVNSFSGTESGFNMSVESKSKISVARMIMLLESSDRIETAVVGGVSESKDEANGSTVTFAVSCTYASEAPEEVAE